MQKKAKNPQKRQKMTVFKQKIKKKA